MSTNLTFVDHIAIESKDIAQSAKWYQDQFNCEVKHQDETWALLKFANISLALVTPGDHPPHFAIVDKNIIDDPKSKAHRDGIHFLYEKDPDSNFIEKIDRPS